MVYNPWDCKESDTTEQLNKTNLKKIFFFFNVSPVMEKLAHQKVIISSSDLV